MKSLPELEALAQSDPAVLARELWQTQQQLQAALEQLQQAQSENEELKRQLFGAKADILTPPQEALLNEIKGDLEEQSQREAPVSQEVLADEEPTPKHKRGCRHPMPEHLERQTVVLEPERLSLCQTCGQPLERIGQETTEELEYVPAKVVVRQLVRLKYACR